MSVLVTTDSIDIGAESAAAAAAGAGGVATFAGYVRGDDGVTALTLEHYPGATEAALAAVVADARARWVLSGVRIVHRVGRMVPGDAIVFVAAAAPHRGPALAACAFLIDRLKTGAPFWKREETAAGDRWVEARSADEVAAGRWE